MFYSISICFLCITLFKILLCFTEIIIMAMIRKFEEINMDNRFYYGDNIFPRKSSTMDFIQRLQSGISMKPFLTIHQPIISCNLNSPARIEYYEKNKPTQTSSDTTVIWIINILFYLFLAMVIPKAIFILSFYFRRKSKYLIQVIQMIIGPTTNSTMLIKLCWLKNCLKLIMYLLLHHRSSANPEIWRWSEDSSRLK